MPATIPFVNALSKLNQMAAVLDSDTLQSMTDSFAVSHDELSDRLGTLIDHSDKLAAGLFEALKATGFDTDSDDGPGALIAGMGLEGFIQLVVTEVSVLRNAYDDEVRP